MTKTVFIIMSSDEYGNSNDRKEIIRQCASESGWSVQIPQYDKHSPSFDLSSALTVLRKSDLVLVDLTNERPSCYFELGLAEASDLKIAALAFQGTPIHQTSLRETVCFFDNLADFRVKIEDVLGCQ